MNASANRLLIGTVADLVAPTPGTRVLDLYSGAGNFTLPLARRGARVLGVERNGEAVRAGRANAARLGLATAAFQAADVAAAVRTMTPGTVDVVVLDPPRAGAADVVTALAALRAPRIVYVSCDPATLARDVRALHSHAYRPGRIQPIDVFPQTYHVETVAELRLT